MLIDQIKRDIIIILKKQIIYTYIIYTYSNNIH